MIRKITHASSRSQRDAVAADCLKKRVTCPPGESGRIWREIGLTSLSFAADTSRAFDMQVVRCGGNAAIAAGVTLQMTWADGAEECILKGREGARGACELKNTRPKRRSKNCMNYAQSEGLPQRQPLKRCDGDAHRAHHDGTVRQACGQGQRRVTDADGHLCQTEVWL